MNMSQVEESRIRALIVDGDESSRNLIRALLSSDRDIELVADAKSADEARQRIAHERPDLLFMDVGIPGGHGFELMRQLKESAPHVIIVTAYSEFIMQAFELQAVDYIVKPIQRPRFAEGIQRAKARIVEYRLAQLARQIAGVAKRGDSASFTHPRENPYPDQLRIRIRRRLMSLSFDDILWIQGASQYSRVHTKNGEHLLARTLASLECELDPNRFFRIHRSAIVNASYVLEVRSAGDGRYNVHITGGMALTLGRARREILGKLLSGIGTSQH